jgi:hypothetical protein
MTQDIIEMTRKAGWSGIYIVWAEPTGEVDWSPYKVSLTVPVTMEQIEAFYKLATAKERGATIKIIKETPFSNWFKADVIEAIRARGEQA